MFLKYFLIFQVFLGITATQAQEKKSISTSCTAAVDSLTVKKEILLTNHEKAITQEKKEKTVAWLKEIFTQHFAEFDDILGPQKYTTSVRVNNCYIEISAKPLDKSKRSRSVVLHTTSPWTFESIMERGNLILEADETLIDSNTLQPREALLHTTFMFKNASESLGLQILKNLQYLSSFCK